MQLNFRGVLMVLAIGGAKSAILSFTERLSVAANASRAACEGRGDLTEIPLVQCSQ